MHVNRREAKTILRTELEKLRAFSYPELVSRLLDRKETLTIAAPSGKRYYVELQAQWDDVPDQNLRVFGSIHDGGWRRFLPLAQLFIRAPNGSFIGE
jgi:hypothetical protein